MGKSILEVIGDRCGDNEVHVDIYLSTLLSNVFLSVLPITAKRVVTALSVQENPILERIIFRRDSGDGVYNRAVEFSVATSPAANNPNAKVVLMPHWAFRNHDAYSYLERIVLGKVLSGEESFTVSRKDGQLPGDEELLTKVSTYVDEFSAACKDLVVIGEESSLDVISRMVIKELYETMKHTMPDLVVEWPTYAEYEGHAYQCTRLLFARCAANIDNFHLESFIAGLLMEIVFHNMPISTYMLYMHNIHTDWLNDPGRTSDEMNPSEMAISLLWSMTTKEPDLDLSEPDGEPEAPKPDDSGQVHFNFDSK